MDRGTKIKKIALGILEYLVVHVQNISLTQREQNIKKKIFFGL